jgi:hypothetical protein
VSKQVNGIIDRSSNNAGSTTHIIDYFKDNVLDKFMWAEDCWLSRRDPVPTPELPSAEAANSIRHAPKA